MRMETHVHQLLKLEISYLVCGLLNRHEHTYRWGSKSRQMNIKQKKVKMFIIFLVAKKQHTYAHAQITKLTL